MHGERGQGTIVSIDLDNIRGKPFMVEFDNEEVHKGTHECTRTVHGRVVHGRTVHGRSISTIAHRPLPSSSSSMAKAPLLAPNHMAPSLLVYLQFAIWVCGYI